MGNTSQTSNSLLAKGQGYRIISIRKKSPLESQVQIFFDFIIDITPNHPPQRSPKDILDKLSGEKPQKPKTKSFLQQIKQYENQQIVLKVVSTKLRSVRNIIVIPNNKWNGSQDLIGIEIRKQRFDEAYDTYFPMMEIANNSPIKRAGIVEGQFLLGCLEFKYVSLNQLIDATYDRFFDKQILDKTINLAVYSILRDQVRIVPMILKRGWGGKGLLGCQFMQGYLYKFPSSSLQQKREILLQKERQKQKGNKIREQLKQCDGASKLLISSLKNTKRSNKNNDHLKQIHKILSVSPPVLPIIQRQQAVNKSSMLKQYQNQEQKRKNKHQKQQDIINNSISQKAFERIQILQRKVKHLQQTIQSVKDYIERLDYKQQQNMKQQE